MAEGWKASGMYAGTPVERKRNANRFSGETVTDPLINKMTGHYYVSLLKMYDDEKKLYVLIRTWYNIIMHFRN